MLCWKNRSSKISVRNGREIDINQKDKYGKTGLDYAKEKGNTDIVKLIESFQFWEACKDRKVEEVQKLLQNSQINTNWQNRS